MKEKNIFTTCLHKETGLMHQLKGKGCEDAVAGHVSEETGVTAVAVSDGAGSCEHAAAGSAIVSETVVQLMAEKFELIWKLDEETAAEYLIRKLCAPIQHAAEKNMWTPESMYATLLCVAVHPDHRFLLFHIGDGAIIGYNPAENGKVLSKYQHLGAENETTFVNVPNTTYKFLRSTESYASFLLMTDGAEPYLTMPDRVAFRAILLQQISFVISERELEEQMADLLQYLRNHCGMSDDASFAVLTDYRRTDEILECMPSAMWNDLLECPKPVSKKKIKEYSLFLQLLHQCPEGVSYKQIGKYVLKDKHKIKNIRKAVGKMFKEELVEEVQGRVYLK